MSSSTLIKWNLEIYSVYCKRVCSNTYPKSLDCLDPTSYVIASYENSSFSPATNQRFRQGCIPLVFTMTNKPSVGIAFHSAAMAAAGMRREEDGTASLHHLIKHTLHGAVLMKTIYMSPLNLRKSSQEWVFAILPCKHWDFFFGLRFLAALWCLCSEWSQSVLWISSLLALWLRWVRLASHSPHSRSAHCSVHKHQPAPARLF